MIKVRTMYFYYGETDYGNFGLTDDESLAQDLDADYRLASIEDIEFHTTATGEPLEGVIHTVEGYWIWDDDLCDYDRL